MNSSSRLCPESVGVTFGLVRIAGAVGGFRVDPETETNGLDLSQHGERALECTS